MARPKPKENTVEIPTTKAVIAMVKMCQDEGMKPLALEFAGFIVEAYDDKESLLFDVLNTFVKPSGKTPLQAQKLMERQFPEELEILKGIFGEFLFGGS